MVTFRIERERLELWIKALHILYYNHYGKTNTFTVNWYDEPSKWVIEDKKKINLHKLSKASTIVVQNNTLYQHRGHSGPRALPSIIHNNRLPST